MLFTTYMLIAHALGDFVFQTDQPVQRKADLKIGAFIKHAIILFLISILPVLIVIRPNYYIDALIVVAIIVGSHQIIDILKEVIQKQVNKYFCSI